MKKLSNRLSAVASFVTGETAADIGTDHGFLPVWLIRNKVCRRVIAADIAQAPLKRAKKTVLDSGFEHDIELRLADGLSGITENETDTVIIAGMGGETISGILERSGWSFENKVLVLQPMSKIAELRRWLDKNGFSVTGEKLTEDDGSLYRVFRAEKNAVSQTEPWEYYAGSTLFNNGDPFLKRWLDIVILKLEHMINGRVSADVDVDPETVEIMETLKEKRRRL